MPRISVPDFVGASNKLPTIQANVSESYNFILGPTYSGGGGKAPSGQFLTGTPGVKPFCNFPDSPIRGLFQINDRAFAVGGSTFAEIFEDGTYGATFAVASDSLLASMCSNGTSPGTPTNQVMVTSGGSGYIFDLRTNALTQITAGGFPSVVLNCEFFEGRFFVAQGGGSRQFNWSSPEDGTAWDPLDFEVRELASDNISSMIRNHTELWIIGLRTAEVWVNSGDPLSPFAPASGIFIEMGAQGLFTPQRVNNTLMWMGFNDNGQGTVLMANGYSPVRVSTTAVEATLQAAATPSNSRGFVFQMNGHIYYALVLPNDLQFTWLYDVTGGVWTKWAIWNPATGLYQPHVAGCHMFVWNKHLVGSLTSGTIYEMSSQFLDEEVAT